MNKSRTAGGRGRFAAIWAAAALAAAGSALGSPGGALMAAPAEAAGLTVNTADDLAWSAGACPASKVATSAATDAAMAKSRHHRRRPPPPPPPPAKKCSLRAAIVQANMDGVRDVITVPAMTIILGFAKGSAEPTTIDPDGCFDLDLTASM